MDPTTFVPQLLVPALSYLVSKGDALADDAASRLGAETWEFVRRLWGRLRAPVEADPVAAAAVQEVVEHPGDKRAEGMLELAVERLLERDPQLAADVSALLEQAPRGATVIGDGNVVVGRDVHGSIVTGDNSSVTWPHPR